MFLRIKNIRNKQGRRYSYVYLVKTVWDKKKQQTKQIVKQYLGKAVGYEPFVAKKIFERDKFTCQICGIQQNLTIDHKIPLAKEGGTNDLKNLHTVCMQCNQKKRDLTDEEIPKKKHFLVYQRRKGKKKKVMMKVEDNKLVKEKVE